jgi:hypothetical protein
MRQTLVRKTSANFGLGAALPNDGMIPKCNPDHYFCPNLPRLDSNQDKESQNHRFSRSMSPELPS